MGKIQSLIDAHQTDVARENADKDQEYQQAKEQTTSTFTPFFDRVDQVAEDIASRYFDNIRKGRGTTLLIKTGRTLKSGAYWKDMEQLYDSDKIKVIQHPELGHLFGHSDKVCFNELFDQYLETLCPKILSYIRESLEEDDPDVHMWTRYAYYPRHTQRGFFEVLDIRVKT